MSHDATNWAIKQRGIKPALKVVLWNLCDRYHPDNGCFPSQETLAEDCEVPRSTLNTYLSELEGLGLILREQRRDKGSKRQQRTRYFFPFEPDFAARKAEKPSPETRHGSAQGESRKQGEPSPEYGESRVQNLDSNPVREPVREPVSEREGASEHEGAPEAHADERAESAASIERDFWRLVKGWPGFDGMPKRPALSAWLKLSSDDRQQASERFPAWLALLKAQKKSHVPAPATYFGEKLWQAVPDQPEQPTGPRMAAPYGKLWMATRFADLQRKAYGPIAGLTGFEQSLVRAGKTTAEATYRDKVRRNGWTIVNTMHERAADAKGYPCSPDLLPIAEGFRQVHRDGHLYAAWRREHERRGWPFLDDTRPPEWVHFPAVGDGWEADPDGAVRAAMDEFAEKLREVRGDEHAA